MIIDQINHQITDHCDIIMAAFFFSFFEFLFEKCRSSKTCQILRLKQYLNIKFNLEVRNRQAATLKSENPTA